MRKLKVAFGVGTSLALAALASASLIQGPSQAMPGGVGNSNVVLSLQSPGSSTIESGSITPAGCTGNTIGPCPGVANSLPTFSSAGVPSASALTLFLDAAEPGSDNLLTLTGLTLNVYGAGMNNNLLFSAPFAVGTLPINLVPSPGQGNNFLNTFVLSFAEAAQLQALFDPNLRVGVSASFSNAQGGPERFLLGARPSTDTDTSPTPAPEPATMALLGTGLLGLGLLQRRRA